MRPLPLTLAALLVCGPSLGQEHGPARASLERFCTGLESLSAIFTETIISPEGEIVEHGGGEVWMQRPDRFRWRYDGEFPELIVADGRRVWIFDQTLEQVTVTEQSGLPADSPLLLLTDLAALDRQFSVAEFGEDAGVLLLELKVRDQEAKFERVLVGMRDDALSYMAMEDAFGMRTEVRFEAIRRNPELDASRFEFTPPEGVDVIGDPGTP